MAILQSAGAGGPSNAPSAAHGHVSPPSTPGLFIKTILPSGAVSCALPCTLYPENELLARLSAQGNMSRRQAHVSSASATGAPQYCEVLVTASPGALTISAVNDVTCALVELERIPVYGTVRGLAKVSTNGWRGGEAADVLLVLADASEVSFLYFEPAWGRIVRGGPSPLFAPAAVMPGARPRKDARLLVAHPRRALAAVATLESTVSVFPVLFMVEGVDAGKVASETVDGVVISMTFVEDDGGNSAVLLALVQKGSQQRIYVFSVGAGSGEGGGLFITPVGSMSTCATRHDDAAVARLHAKLTGSPLKAPPDADHLAMVRGFPFLFVVCLEGRVAVADARVILRNAMAQEPSSGNSSSRAHAEPGLVAQSCPSQHGGASNRASGLNLGDSGSSGGGHASPIDDPSSSVGNNGQNVMQVDAGSDLDEVSGASLAQVEGIVEGEVSDPNQSVSAAAATVALSTLGDGLSGPATTAPSTSADADSEGWGASEWSGPSHQGTAAATEGHMASVSSPTDLSTAHEDDSAVDALAEALSSSPPEQVMSELQIPRSDVPLPANTPPAAFGPANVRGAARHSLPNARITQSLLSYVHTPPHIALDVGTGCEGIVTAVASAGSHLSGNAKTRAVDDSDHENGLYIVMESGRMFALKWRKTLRRGGPPSFVIPQSGGEGPRKGNAWCDPSPFFSLELVGDVGPAIALASLQSNLLYIANDGADGSLRQVQQQEASHGSKFILHIKQGFLNMAPISDFDIVPVATRRSGSNRRRRARVDFDPTAARVSKQPRKDESLFLDEDGDEKHDPQLVVCSGVGPYGTVRIVSPGAHVSVYSSSEVGSQFCNDMWGLRLTKSAFYHALLVMTFPTGTGVFCIAPPPRPETGGTIARFVDGSEASGLLLGLRTIACGRVRDGVVAQVHRSGVRFIWLKKRDPDDTEPTVREAEGWVSGSLVERFLDWECPEGSFISRSCVGEDNVVLSLMSPSLNPRLVVLQPDDTIPDRSTVVVAASVELNHEVSVLVLPAWMDDGDEVSQTTGTLLRDVVLVGTYAPEVQVRSLRNGLDVIAMTSIPAWPPLHPSTSPGGVIAGTGSSKIESLCGVSFGSRSLVAAGLRDGHVACFELLPSSSHGGRVESSSTSASYQFEFLSRRCLGVEHVRLSVVTVSFGKAIMAECERPWLGTMVSSGVLSWLPLNFSQTIAGASLTLPGAERCVALVSSDNVLHICGVKKTTPFTVSTVRVGDTPRRVIPVGSPVSFLIVATSNNDGALPACSAPREQDALTSYLRAHVAETQSQRNATGEERSSVFRANVEYPATPRTQGDTIVSEEGKTLTSDIRVFDCSTRELVCKSTLLANELVHVLLLWKEFVVVGTSFGLRESIENGSTPCECGRVLLFTVKSGTKGERKLEECSSVVLPGAVLAGDVNEAEDFLCVSSNEHIFVFAMTANRRGIFEVARTSTRMLVVSISLRKGLVCAADRKDSVVFYRIMPRARALVRERGDVSRRVVSDNVLVDDHTAIVTDHHGHLFSLSYDFREVPRLAENVYTMADVTVPRRLERRVENLADSLQPGASSPAGYNLESLGARMELGSDIAGGNRGLDYVEEMLRILSSGRPHGRSVGDDIEMSEAPTDAGSDSSPVERAGLESGSPRSRIQHSSGAQAEIDGTYPASEAHAHHISEAEGSGDLGRPLQSFSASRPSYESDIVPVDAVHATGRFSAGPSTGAGSSDAPNVRSDAGRGDTGGGLAAGRNGDCLDHEDENDRGADDEMGIEAGEEQVDAARDEDESEDPGNRMEPSAEGVEDGQALPADDGDESAEDDDSDAEIGNEDGEGQEAQEDQAIPPVTLTEDDLLAFRGRQPVQRHLVCNHSYNMNQVALRVRCGSFSRHECRNPHLFPNGQPSAGVQSFWGEQQRRTAIVGTLSGAIVAAAPVGRDDMSVLCQLANVLSDGNYSRNMRLGMNHAIYRHAFGQPGLGTVDGDLLSSFLELDSKQQLQAAEAAGCRTPEAKQRLCDIIVDLCDRTV